MRKHTKFLERQKKRNRKMNEQKTKLNEETECPQQCTCEDFRPTTSGKTCVHYDIDEYGNEECHSQYDEEEWDLEEVEG